MEGARSGGPADGRAGIGSPADTPTVENAFVFSLSPLLLFVGTAKTVIEAKPAN
jgi:hypothetical protein